MSHDCISLSNPFGNDLIQSLPPGSIYLGGTDPGRFIVTALEKSQMDGEHYTVIWPKGSQKEFVIA
jgi:hypothetical protein